MSIKKKIATIACVLAMASAMTGCADTTYICKSGDYSVKAGVYIYYVDSTIQSQAYVYYYTNGKASDDIINEPYGDGTMNVGEYAQETAYKNCQQVLVAEKKFDELGLSLTDEDIDSINGAVEYYWDADYYEAIGVSKESMEAIQTSGVMLDKLFEAYYEKGGIMEVSDTEISSHLSNNYVRFKLISIKKSDNSDGEGAKEIAEKYKALAEEKTFDEVIAEYNEEQKSEDEEETTSEEDDEEEVDNNAFINKNSSSYSSNEVVKYIDGTMKNDEISTYEDDNYWYVIQKLDVLDYPKYVEDNRASLLSEMKSEDFQTLIEDWITEYGIERNDKSFARYTAKRIMKDINKYNEAKGN